MNITVRPETVEDLTRNVTELREAVASLTTRVDATQTELSDLRAQREFAMRLADDLDELIARVTSDAKD